MYGKTPKHPPLRCLAALGLGFALVSASLFCGCAKQQAVDAPEPLAVAGLDKAEAMTLSEDVLARMHFAIEKADPNAGIVRTAPLTGSQFFEFWRSDSVGSFNKSEANLQNVRRIVEVQVDEADGVVHIDCRAEVQRLSLTEHRVSSSARAYQMHSESTQSLQRLSLSEAQARNMAWVDLGPDNELAAAVLKRIEARIAERQAGRGEQGQ